MSFEKKFFRRVKYRIDERLKMRDERFFIEIFLFSKT